MVACPTTVCTVAFWYAFLNLFNTPWPSTIASREQAPQPLLRDCRAYLQAANLFLLP